MGLRVKGQTQLASCQQDPEVAAFEEGVSSLNGHDLYEAAGKRVLWARGLLSSGDAEGGKNLLQEAQDKLEELDAKRDLADAGGLLDNEWEGSDASRVERESAAGFAAVVAVHQMAFEVESFPIAGLGHCPSSCLRPAGRFAGSLVLS
jgi:hypothetical protein